MNKTEKPQRQTTPIGEAKWAHLSVPKAPYQGKGDAKYMLDVVFDKDDPAWKDWAAAIMSKIRAMPDQIDKKTNDAMRKQNPIKRELDANDQPTGRFYVSFKTSDKFKPGVFDRFGQELAEGTLVGNGSKVRVSYLENVFDAFGGGINFYLNAVQVKELVEYKSQNAAAYGFDVDTPAPSKAAHDDPFGDDFGNDSSAPF